MSATVAPTIPSSKVLSHARGALWAPYVGQVVRASGPEWAELCSASQVVPGDYLVESHEITSERSAHRGEATVRLVHVDRIDGEAVKAREALSLWESRQAALATAKTAKPSKSKGKGKGPKAPVTDPLAALRGLNPEGVAALVALLKG